MGIPVPLSVLSQGSVLANSLESDLRGHNTYFFLGFRLGRRLFSGHPVSFSLEGM